MAVDLKVATPDTTMAAGSFLFGADSQAAAAPSIYTIQSVADFIGSVLLSVTIGGMTITANSTNRQYLANSGVNSIDGSVIAWVLGGGSAGFPNIIGSAGLPTGTDFTPTGWAADSGYVADSSAVALVVGGYDIINNQTAGVVVGGGHNFLKYDANGHSVIVGGSYNVIAAGRSFIGGGRRNTITGGVAFSFIGGGDNNNITGNWAAIPGGLSNTASGDYSLAWGRRAKATANGTAALADNTDSDFTVGTAGVFGARYAGGYWLTGGNVGIGKTSPTVKLDVVAALGADGAISRLYDSVSDVALEFRAQTGLSGLATKHVDLVGLSSASDLVLSPSTDTRGLLVLKDGGNLGIRTTSQFGSGTGGVIGIGNCTAAPSTNPTGGGVLYVESGALKFRGSSGTVTTLGAA